MILALKIAVIVVICGCAAFIGRYHKRTGGAAWRDPIGRTVIIPSVLSAGEVVPWLLAAFFRFSTTGNAVAAWAWIAFLFLGGAAMWWRFFVFGREDPDMQKDEVSP